MQCAHMSPLRLCVLPRPITQLVTNSLRTVVTHQQDLSSSQCVCRGLVGTVPALHSTYERPSAALRQPYRQPARHPPAMSAAASASPTIASTSAASPSKTNGHVNTAAPTSTTGTNGASDVKGKAAASAATGGEEERQPYDDSDIDRILAQEATGLQRDEEVGSAASLAFVDFGSLQVLASVCPV